MELIASNKRFCSLVRVLICLSSSSVDDNWSSCWIKFRSSSESAEDEVSVSSSEVSMSFFTSSWFDPERLIFLCSEEKNSAFQFLGFQASCRRKWQ